MRWRLGTFVGGPIGDRIGRKPILWISILGVLPLSLLLPFVDLFWTNVLAVLIGIVMASAFPAIMVYAQELLPGRVGMIAGLFFGFAFGMGGIGAVVIGWLADLQGHPVRLPALRLAAGDRPPGRLPARPGPPTRLSAASRAPERLARLSGSPPVLQAQIGDQMGADAGAGGVDRRV